MLNKPVYTDFLIVGGGIAGLNAAYQASQFGSVTIITSKDSESSNSWLAQGGIAATLDEMDSFESHIDDTLDAGRGLCDGDCVNILVKEGKYLVTELIEMGMEFEKVNDNFSLGMEGGHSQRRILHADGNSTGKAVLTFLLNEVQKNKNIKVLNNTECIEIVKNNERVVGAYAYSTMQNTILHISSKFTIIATGGYSGIFKRTTNYKIATGEGISIGMNAGAVLKDMEFVQFHPTSFYSDTGESFLISEAVRGEGAYLLNHNFERFMLGRHPLNELAPRDVISKAIYLEIKNSQEKFVYLDMRHLNLEILSKRFPNIINSLKRFSLDISKDLIPIVPAAHYSIGGIDSDLDGRTNIDGLYVCGEASSTGVHGANRLASNSLLECLVFSKRAVLSAANEKPLVSSAIIPLKEFTNNINIFNEYEAIRKQVQLIFSKLVGILRDEESLQLALSKVKNLSDGFIHNKNDIQKIKTNNLLNLADVIIRAAIVRRESRGTHQRSDYPSTADEYLGHYYSLKSEIYFEELKCKLKKTI